MSLSGLPAESPKSSEILNEKLLSCGALLQKSELIKIFKQLNDSKKKLIKLKELNYLDDLDELEQIKRLEDLEKSKKSLISSQLTELTELKELDEKIENLTLSLNEIHNDKLTKDKRIDKKQIVSENINSEIITLNTQKNILKKLISTYNDKLIEFDLKNIKNLIELIKELKDLKDKIINFIILHCDSTISYQDIDKFLIN